MAEAIKRSRLKLDRHPLKPLNEAKNEALRRFHGGIALSLVKSIRSKLKSFVVISLSQNHHSFTPSMLEGVETAALFAGFGAGSTFAAVAPIGRALSF
jgi:hypothetical protein